MSHRIIVLTIFRYNYRNKIIQISSPPFFLFFSYFPLQIIRSIILNREIRNFFYNVVIRQRDSEKFERYVNGILTNARHNETNWERDESIPPRFRETANKMNEMPDYALFKVARHGAYILMKGGCRISFVSGGWRSIFSSSTSRTARVKASWKREKDRKKDEERERERCVYNVATCWIQKLVVLVKLFPLESC